MQIEQIMQNIHVQRNQAIHPTPILITFVKYCPPDQFEIVH